jgi:hypothetical protein
MDKGVVVTFGEPLMQHFIDSGFDSVCFDIWNYIRNIGIHLS